MSAGINIALDSQAPKPDKKPAPRPDPIFFTTEQISVGTVLVYVGRTDPGSLWVVTEIVLYNTHFAARRKSKLVSGIRDTIYLRRLGSKDMRQGSFAYLSYSAIWRLRDA